MSEHKGITGELRRVMNHTTTAVCPMVKLSEYEFEHRCDAIDAVHAGLERENAELRARVAEAELDNRSESMHIGEATVTITPTLDWSGVARELRAIADTLGSCNCSNSERTNETCRHAPTVEDVLREFICDHEEDVRDEVDLIAEYATKLRLAGDGE